MQTTLYRASGTFAYTNSPADFFQQILNPPDFPTASPAIADRYIGTANYVACAGRKRFSVTNNDGVIFYRSFTRFAKITDGQSNVFFLGERDAECGAGTWAGTNNGSGDGPRGGNYSLGNVYQKPNQRYTGGNLYGGLVGSSVTCVYGFSSRHPGGTHFAMGDGKVIFISENIDFNNDYTGAGGQNDGGLGPNAGVYQRLGVRDDGLSVGVP
ncbi:MAG: DUF1559 domain-containing protein [Planctomycetaceae bacterium]